MEALREDLSSVTNGEHELYREVVEAANYAAEHPGLHYGGKFETTDLFVEHWSDEEVLQRLEASLERAEELKENLDSDIIYLRFEIEKYAEEGEKPDDYRIIEEELNDAEQTLEEMEKELQHIQEMKESPPEEDADEEYVKGKETKAKTLADKIDYTPKRREEA